MPQCSANFFNYVELKKEIIRRKILRLSTASQSVLHRGPLCRFGTLSTGYGCTIVQIYDSEEGYFGALATTGGGGGRGACPQLGH